MYLQKLSVVLASVSVYTGGIGTFSSIKSGRILPFKAISLEQDTEQLLVHLAACKGSFLYTEEGNRITFFSGEIILSPAFPINQHRKAVLCSRLLPFNWCCFHNSHFSFPGIIFYRDFQGAEKALQEALSCAQSHCYGLNCVPPEDVDILIPKTYEFGNRVFAND